MLHSVSGLAVGLATSIALLMMPTATGPRLTVPVAPATDQVADSRTSTPDTAGRHDLGGRLCGPEPTSAAGWQHLFDGLDGDWSGGDGSSSTRLPDGRLLWVFGDTLVGRVSAGRERLAGTHLVHNSMVVTDGDCASVHPTQTDAFAGAGTTWLWPTHSVVTRSSTDRPTQLAVFAQRIARTGTVAGHFRRVGTTVVTVTVPWLGAPSVGTPTDLEQSQVLWGAAVVPDGSVTWIYGTRDHREALVFGRDLLLARSPSASVGNQSTWRYRTASGGWSAVASAAAVVRSAHAGVSTVPSAAKISGVYHIVTKPQEFLDDRVVLLSAAHPWGPWSERLVTTAPSTATRPRYSPAFVAGAFSGGRGVVVVNQTATTRAGVMADAAACRPRFVDVSGLGRRPRTA